MNAGRMFKIQMHDDESKLNALASLVSACQYVGEGDERVDRAAVECAREVIAYMLGREPTEDEIAQVIEGRLS